MDATITTDKKIQIIGTSNRYQIKKLVKPRETEHKIRAVVENWDINRPTTWEEQWNLLQSNSCLLMKQEIERKRGGYRQQDKQKGLFCEDLFVSFSDILETMLKSKLQCIYCLSPMFVLYDHVREKKQWTLDRLDNSKGHNRDNVVVSCLECNLKRRRTSQTAFLFTKHLVIKREGIEGREGK